MANVLSTLASIILNMLSCPVIVLTNMLVIMAVKTRPRLQSMYNILLACLAATDLLVGTITQPTFIAVEIFGIAGDSVATYCSIFENILKPLLFLSILPSLFHLTLISVERYTALKCALRYHEIVTKLRLTIAVTFSWFLAVVYTLLRMLKINSLASAVYAARPFLLILCLLVIAYCHIVVYSITRRHKKQIITEQISGEVAAKFLEEKKAWKTTSIIIGFAFLSYFVAVIPNLAKLSSFITQQSPWRGISYSFLMLNSLCNPIIYSWRSKKIRKAIIALIRKDNQG